MLGFEIKINDEEPIHVASDGVLTVSVHFGAAPAHYKIKHKDEMIISGLSLEEYYMYWPGRELKMGDKIKIMCTELEEMTPIEKIHNRSKNEMLQAYHELKQELESKGII